MGGIWLIAETASLDAYVQAAGNTETASLDAYVQAEQSETASAEAWLQAQGQPATASADAWLVAPGAGLVSASADAYLRPTGNTETADALAYLRLVSNRHDDPSFERAVNQPPRGIGPRTLEQLESAVRAVAIELDEETLDKLDKIFPGPGGEAPKAYAW